VNGEQQHTEESEDDTQLHPHWASLESRLLRKQTKLHGPSGRSNKKLADEDHWYQAGAYVPEAAERSKQPDKSASE
jgi:hypothetical protein